MDDETLHKANELKEGIERLDKITSGVFYNSHSRIRRLADKFIFKNRNDGEFYLEQDEVKVLDRYLYEKWARLEREYRNL